MLKSQNKIYSLGNLQDLLLDKLRTFTQGIFTRELGERLKKVLFDETVEQYPLTKDPRIRYWFDNFHFYLEIIHSFERLYQAYGYLQKFPAFRYYNFFRINELTWIRYHIEFFLQENYILHQRTIKWVNFLLIRAKRNPAKKVEEVILVKIRNRIDKAFTGVNKIRGGHVHEFTFEGKGFMRAETEMFLISTLKQKKLGPIKNITLFEISTEWREKIRENVLSLIESYNAILSVLGKIMLRLE